MASRKPNQAQVQANQAFYAQFQRDKKSEVLHARMKASGQTDADLMQMIDDAVAAGRVTVVPPVYRGDE